MTVSFFKNAEDFELTNDMFSYDAFSGQGAVMSFLFISEYLATPALMRGAAVSVELSNALKAAV